jgi:hypothetical protein
MPLAPRRPALPPRRPSIGLTPDAESLHQWQAATYHFGALRQHAPTPPKPSHATARDGDLARVDARYRYDQAMRTRQMALEAGRQKRAWAQVMNPASAQYVIRQTPNEDYYKPEAVRQRAIEYKLAQQRAQLLADHPLEAQVGEGVMIGSNIVTSTVLSEVALLRLASGLRWAGATRAALATRSLTLADQAESGMLGVRSGWLSSQKSAGLVLFRGGTDALGQGLINYTASSKSGLDRVLDAAGGVNLTETGLSAYGIRPFGVGVISSAYQYSWNDGYRSVFNHRISPQAFLAQAAIGTSVGYLGEYGGRVLNRHVAYGLYQGAAQRAGFEAGYPVWLGAKYAFHYGLPLGFGSLASYYQALSQNQWPGLSTPPSPAPSQP